MNMDKTISTLFLPGRAAISRRGLDAFAKEVVK